MNKEELDSLESQLAPLEKEWYEKALMVARDAYPWVPYPLVKFRWLLEVALKVNQGPLVELGAGIGTKVLMAQAMGVDAVGVENHAGYLEEAKRLGANVVEGDVRDVDVSAYGIVYTYHPFFGQALEAGFEGWLQGTMLPGSVFICPRVAFWPGKQWEVLYCSKEDVVAVKLPGTRLLRPAPAREVRTEPGQREAQQPE